MAKPLTAVLIPCYNEEAAITQVVNDFRVALPDAHIYVFDNASTDDTSRLASSAGAYVRQVRLRGKGNVVRRMFADVEADIYLLVDGDATYDARSAPALIHTLVTGHLDMVVANRMHEGRSAYRPGHQLGNRLLNLAMKRIFGGSFTDILSGYRAFSRRYAKSFPAISQSFEIETELTIHALELRMPTSELATPYGPRPAGSQSKLHTYSDGIRILSTILKLFITERPLRFYSILTILLALLALGISLPLLPTYLETGLVPRFPTAILATGVGLLAAISFVIGIILENVTIGRREVKHFQYLIAGTLPYSGPDKDQVE